MFKISMKLIMVFVVFFSAKYSLADSCGGTPRSCGTWSGTSLSQEASNQRSCIRQDGCFWESRQVPPIGQYNCRGTADRCSSFSVNSCEDQSGCRIISDPPEPVSAVRNFEAFWYDAFSNATGYQPVSLSSSFSDQFGKLWFNTDRDRTSNIFSRWADDSAKYEIQYYIDFSEGGNSHLEDYDWQPMVISEDAEELIYSRPQKYADLQYNTLPQSDPNHNKRARVPTKRYSPSGDLYIMVYYRIRGLSTDGSRKSDWRYTRGIWIWGDD